MNEWLHLVAITSLSVALACFLTIMIDLLAGNRQKMAVMNAVWPITALYAGPFALWAYFTIGRLSTKKRAAETAGHNGKAHSGMDKPFWQVVLVGATHCGSGCTLGDLIAEWIVVAVPIVIFGRQIFGTWLLDFVVAYLFGIVFQYFSIQPMKKLPPAEGLWAAIKADTLSLIAWQIGMYGWMAIVTFAFFQREIPKTDPLFWFMMQLAMLVGFATSYPVNWWLLTAGIKEKM